MSEAAAARGCRLFLSNSMAVRDADRFGAAHDACAVNRGLAGIDGVPWPCADPSTRAEAPP